MTWQPKCWKVLLDHRSAPYISPLMFAVAGVNAVLNFDLPFALVTACVRMNRELREASNYAEYEYLIGIFAYHMKFLRQHFEARLEERSDASLVSRVENLLGDLVVAVARKLAWKRALQLWQVRYDVEKMSTLAKSRDKWVAVTSLALFELEHIPNLAFRVMRQIPGPTRRIASAGLARMSWGTEPRDQQ